MYWLIETEHQLDYLISKNYKEAFIEIIPLHNNVHPAINDVSLVYFKPSIETKGYMLCIDHSEALSISKTHIHALLQNINRVWVRDKKNALYYFPIKGLLDLNLITPTYIPELPNVYNVLYQRYPNKVDINRIIPIVKHYEVCEHIYNAVKPAFKQELPPYFDFYNNHTTLAFFGIEKNGIKIDETVFEEHFNPTNAIYSIANGKIYTSYNLYTTTKRPSNSFNGVNFAALNKDSGARKSFIPQNDEFLEFDISAYHPHLASRLVAFDFGDGDVHQTFADMYGVSYKEAKELTFKQLYGGVFKEYEHLEFFQQVKEFINNNWNDYNNLGRVVVPNSGYWLEKDKLDNMNPQKLFNYILQNLETSTNVSILMKMHRILKGKKTKIVLYTYDSFLIDLSHDEMDIIDEIKQIFKNCNLSIKEAHGTSYDFK